MRVCFEAPAIEFRPNKAGTLRNDGTCKACGAGRLLESKRAPETPKPSQIVPKPTISGDFKP